MAAGTEEERSLNLFQNQSGSCDALQSSRELLSRGLRSTAFTRANKELLFCSSPSALPASAAA